MPFEFLPTDIPEVVVVEAIPFNDGRGYFFEAYRRSAFVGAGIDLHFVQENVSRSRRGVFRGLHYQNPPHAQGKLVSVIRGEVVDFAVDIRKSSPTYAKSVAVVLSDTNHRALWVPPGFAHGFYCSGEEADVVYLVTAEFAPECEGGVAWDDPEIGLSLPSGSPILSERDSQLPSLEHADNLFVYERANP